MGGGEEDIHCMLQGLLSDICNISFHCLAVTEIEYPLQNTKI